MVERHGIKVKCMESTDPADKQAVEAVLASLRVIGAPNRESRTRFHEVLLGPLRRRARRLLRGVPSAVAETDDLVNGIQPEFQRDLDHPERLTQVKTYNQLMGRFFTLMRWRRNDLLRRENRKEPIGQSTHAQPIDERSALGGDGKRQAILDAIEALPEDLRRVVKLVYLEGRKNTEAAREMNLDESTVRRRLSKAIEILRPLLAEHAPSTGE